MQLQLLERAFVEDSSADAGASFVRVTRVRAVCAFVCRAVLPVCVVGCRGVVAMAGAAAGRVHGMTSYL